MKSIIIMFITLPLSLVNIIADTGSSDQNDTRYVFAHYMVCIPTYGGNSKVEDYKREIRTAQSAGIDGFALNCGGWSLRESHYKKRTQLIYRAAEELNSGFKLFISADYATKLTLDETRDMVESFRYHPNQFCYQGKPVLSTFGGGRKQADFMRREFTGERSVCYVPFFYPSPAAEMPKQAQVDQVFNDYNEALDGFFHFGAAGTPEQITASNRLLAEKWLSAGKLFMAGITPYYRGQGGNYRVYGSRGFEGMARQWEGAIRDGATWVEIVTWNDWGEASYIAPFGDAGETDLWNGHWGQMLSHAAFMKASRYYIDWYKSGKQPQIREDALYYFYRLHPKSLDGIRKKPGSKDAALPTRPRRADMLSDEVFVTLFLTAPAQLTIYSGSSQKSFDVKAGVCHLSMPFQPGSQRFVLKRGSDAVKSISDEKTKKLLGKRSCRPGAPPGEGPPGKGTGPTGCCNGCAYTDIIIDKTGEHAISGIEAVGNFNIFGGMAK